MPIKLFDDVAVKSYEKTFINEYQSQIGEQLKGSTLEDTSVDGEEKVWSFLDGLTCDPYGSPQSQVVGKKLNGYQRVTTFSPFTCDVFIPKFKKKQTLSDLMSQLPRKLAIAAATRKDQIKLDTMAAHSVPGQVFTTNKKLDVDTIRAASAILDAAGVPGKGRVMVAHTSRKYDLMSEDHTINTQFTNNYSLVSGQVADFMDFKLNFIATPKDMPGIATDTVNNKQHVYFFHPDAIGYASQVNPSIGMEMKNDIKSIYSWVDFSAGCTVLQDQGLLVLEVDITPDTGFNFAAPAAPAENDAPAAPAENDAPAAPAENDAPAENVYFDAPNDNYVP